MGRLPPGRARTPCALVALIALAACEETVPLGSDCPPFGTRCIVPQAAQDDATRIDASSEGMAPRDAGLTHVDAAGDGTDAGTLALDVRNPSFELSAGTGGDIINSGENEAAPWYTCRGGLNVAPQADLRNLPQGDPTPADLVGPTDGDAFVSTSFFFGTPVATELFQELGTPMRAGQPYAFVLDVRSASGGLDNIAIEAWGATGTCFPTERLFASRAISDEEGWVSLCFTFTPANDHTRLVLEARSVSGAVSPGSRLFFDHLRTSPDCP